MISRSRRSYRIQDLMDTLNEQGYDPIAELLKTLEDPEISIDARIKVHAEVCRYVYPRRRESAVRVGFSRESSLIQKGETVLAQLSDGSLGPEQAAVLMSCLEKQARLVETLDLETRIAALEERIEPSS